jgi:ribosome biogenesis protein ENP2
MLLTANEGKQQHAFLIPQLGPAPKWCTFLDNIVEEMAEDPDDPNAFSKNHTGEVYDNLKFLTLPQLRALKIDHLLETHPGILKPYMHGYFIKQKLYEEARLVANPEVFQEQRQKSIQEKITKERESRIRGNKKVAVKVNRKLAERLLERQEKSERRSARKLLEKRSDADMLDADEIPVPNGASEEVAKKPAKGLLADPRFAKLFEDEDFEVDEESREFASINPSTTVAAKLPKGLTAVEEEELADRRGSSSDDSSSDSEGEQKHAPAKEKDDGRISSVSYKRSQRPKRPEMVVSSSKRKPQQNRDRSFGERAASFKEKKPSYGGGSRGIVGEREITFTAAKEKKERPREREEREVRSDRNGGQRHDRKDRRSASGNVFRKM